MLCSMHKPSEDCKICVNAGFKVAGLTKLKCADIACTLISITSKQCGLLLQYSY